MKGFLAFLNLKFIPTSPDFGLLALRVSLGGSMLLLHGWKKAELYFGWGDWAGKGVEAARKAQVANFPDPLRIGSQWNGPQWTLLSLTFVEVVCSILLILGFCARFAATGLAIAMGIAFFIHHQRILAPHEKSGELALVYFMAFTALVFAGPGKLSFDGGGSDGGH